jgi:hypothetical protein
MTDRIAILIVGMHRSGTSALTRTVSLLGASLPRDLVGPNEGNPHGHWEPQGIVELNDRMLADGGSEVYSIADISEEWFKSPRAASFAEEAKDVLQKSFGGDPMIVLKDPRVALLLPIWHKALEELGYRCVHLLPLRHPDNVTESLRRRHLKTIPYDAWPTPRGQAVWLRYTIASVVRTRDLPRSFVNYAELLKDWRSTLTKAAVQLDFSWPRMGTKADQVIDGFLHPNELAEGPAVAARPETGSITTLTTPKLAGALYSVLAFHGDNDRQLVDEIAQAFNARRSSVSDLIYSYEQLFTLLWQQHEEGIALKKQNENALLRISGMSEAIQRLWADLTRASNDNATVKQNLGSTNERVVSLQSALDHLEKVLVESNQHRDTYFKSFAEAKHLYEQARQEAGQEIARKDQQILYHEQIIAALHQSTSWRITAPLRSIMSLLKR